MSRFVVVICVVFLVGMLDAAGRRGNWAQAAEPVADGNAECASCHRAIYQRYKDTPMANASGRAADGVMAADFEHAASGVRFRVETREGRVWLSYTRSDEKRRLEGRQELRYFIGSGLRGRTYLFEQEGYWFEAPVNWYAKKRMWDMAPNHLEDREVPLTMPVDAGCLHCHASGVASALPDARNHYEGEPFAQGGVTCAACHGDGAAHVGSGGKVRLMNIDGLAPVRRDSVCLSCHLEGQVTIARAGKRFEDMKPGDDLFGVEQVFVYRGQVGSGGRATSQWEALLESECKKQSGDRLTCTTCHDPHGSPGPEERVGFYRAKCLGCHDAGAKKGFAARHHADKPDCTACHMARMATSDIAHEQVTDHFIRKRVSDKPAVVVKAGELEAVGGGATPERGRDLGLAYAEMAARGDREAVARAMELLTKAETSAADGDAELHARLGFLEEVRGDGKTAAREYRQALAANPYESLALGNLGLMEAQSHHAAEAIRLWRVVVEHDPTEVGAGLNLAVVECALGDRGGALNALGRVLEFAPDEGKAREMEAAIRSGKAGCSGGR